MIILIYVAICVLLYVAVTPLRDFLLYKAEWWVAAQEIADEEERERQADHAAAQYHANLAAIIARCDARRLPSTN